jgi:hydrogenase-4 component E
MTGAAGLAGAMALALSFVLLFAGRIDTVLRIGALQAMAAAVAAGAQGWAEHAASLCFAALLAFALNGMALPLVFRRLAGRTTMPSAAGRRRGFAISATAAAVLVAVSVAGAMRLTQSGQFDPLALGLSILLLGLLLIALRSHPLLAALGLLSSQSGMILAACAIHGLPLPALVLAAVPLVPALVAASVWLHDADRPSLAPPWA